MKYDYAPCAKFRLSSTGTGECLRNRKETIDSFCFPIPLQKSDAVGAAKYIGATKYLEVTLEIANFGKTLQDF